VLCWYESRLFVKRLEMTRVTTYCLLTQVEYFYKASYPVIAWLQSSDSTRVTTFGDSSNVENRCCEDSTRDSFSPNDSTRVTANDSKLRSGSSLRNLKTYLHTKKWDFLLQCWSTSAQIFCLTVFPSSGVICYIFRIRCSIQHGDETETLFFTEGPAPAMHSTLSTSSWFNLPFWISWSWQSPSYFYVASDLCFSIPVPIQNYISKTNHRRILGILYPTAAKRKTWFALIVVW